MISKQEMYHQQQQQFSDQNKVVLQQAWKQYQFKFWHTDEQEMTNSKQMLEKPLVTSL
jgi:hypothetical protein